MTELDIAYICLGGVLLAGVAIAITFVWETAETKFRRRKRNKLYRKKQKELRKEQLKREAEIFYSMGVQK